MLLWLRYNCYLSNQAAVTPPDCSVDIPSSVYSDINDTAAHASTIKEHLVLCIGVFLLRYCATYVQSFFNMLSCGLAISWCLSWCVQEKASNPSAEEACCIVISVGHPQSSLWSNCSETVTDLVNFLESIELLGETVHMFPVCSHYMVNTWLVCSYFFSSCQHFRLVEQLTNQNSYTITAWGDQAHSGILEENMYRFSAPFHLFFADQVVQKGVETTCKLLSMGECPVVRKSVLLVHGACWRATVLWPSTVAI